MTNPLLPIDPQNYADLLANYYDRALAQRGAWEMAYYEAFGELPAHTVVIERVEAYEGGTLWIHRDRDATQ